MVLGREAPQFSSFSVRLAATGGWLTVSQAVTRLNEI
ncbi:hypothetical protein C7450_109162 [Chelatococcus asaccharovorans]|uniref:Uncharacterized protein n=1 Tax=Chelatococcus asaccharovorans TaxID=28210 RepID=A0A2V3U0C6_9HYPH|nr:hypothetical protein C7450_109162 [Chelatococcus asaccharovorans]